MSMTQIVFLRKTEMPTNGQIQDVIQKLGYDFKILNDHNKQINDEGIECVINDHHTYFETCIEVASDVIIEYEADWIKTDITNQDIAISFFWGSNTAAGTCIGLISIGLIDLSNALSYYMDDEMKYSREMLVTETSLFLTELEKENKSFEESPKSTNSKPNNSQTTNTFWNKIKNIFK